VLAATALPGSRAGRRRTKTLRYRILHTAARGSSAANQRKIRIPQTWPWADELAAAFHPAFALPAPT
jgi:hypothetical protein